MRLDKLASCLAIAVAAAANTGCVTTKEEGDLLRRDGRRLSDDLQQSTDQAAERDKRLSAVEEKLREIENVQKGIDERSNRNRADFGAEVEALRQEVAGLRGALETKEYQLRERELQLGASQQQVTQLETRLVELEKKVTELAIAKAAPPPAPVPEPPKGPQFPSERQALYDFSKRAFDERRYEECREGFTRFIKQFPKDKELLDNAYFWHGECFFAEKQYDKAILSYQKVYTDFPKSEKADGSLYKMGMSFTALGYADDARVFYEELLQKFPKSALLKETKARLAELPKTKKKAAPPRKKK